MPVKIVDFGGGLDEFAKAIPAAIEEFQDAEVRKMKKMEIAAKLAVDNERREKELAEYQLSAQKSGFDRPENYRTPLQRRSGGGVITDPVERQKYKLSVISDPDLTDEQKAQMLYEGLGDAPGYESPSVVEAPQDTSFDVAGGSEDMAPAAATGLMQKRGFMGQQPGLMGQGAQDLPGGWGKVVSNPDQKRKKGIEERGKLVDLKTKELNLSEGLRKEYNALPETKSFNILRNSYSSLKSAAGRDSAAGDMSMVFQYMKMLDPNSTVREGEQAQASQATNIPGEVMNAYNKAVKGTRLNAKQRNDFVSTAKSLLESSRAHQEKVLNRYVGLAGSYGVKPDMVVDSETVAPIKDQPETKFIGDTQYIKVNGGWQKVK